MDPSLAAFLPSLAWAVFAAATALAVTLGVILAYHWFRYALNKQMSFTMLILYGVVTLMSLFALLASTITIATP